MIWCQTRLAIMFVYSIMGIFEIHWGFVFLSIMIAIISVTLGYKKEGWD